MSFSLRISNLAEQLILGRESKGQICDMLDSLVTRLLQAGRAATLAPLLQPVIFALAESAEAEADTVSGLSESSPVVKLILRLVVEVAFSSLRLSA